MHHRKHHFIFAINGSWGLLQSLIGFIFFLALIDKPHFKYKGCIVTTDVASRFGTFGGGISLGLFVFIYKPINPDDAQHDGLLRHEYGHCLQSALLGPLYLLFIGLPSFLGLRIYNKRQKPTPKNYYTRIESWADALGGVHKPPPQSL